MSTSFNAGAFSEFAVASGSLQNTLNTLKSMGYAEKDALAAIRQCKSRDIDRVLDHLFTLPDGASSSVEAEFEQELKDGTPPVERPAFREVFYFELR